MKTQDRALSALISLEYAYTLINMLDTAMEDTPYCRDVKAIAAAVCRLQGEAKSELEKIERGEPVNER